MQSEAMVLGYLDVPINYGGVSIERGNLAWLLARLFNRLCVIQRARLGQPLADG
jgi:hypothetical protein